MWKKWFFVDLYFLTKKWFSGVFSAFYGQRYGPTYFDPTRRNMLKKLWKLIFSFFLLLFTASVRSRHWSLYELSLTKQVIGPGGLRAPCVCHACLFLWIFKPIKIPPYNCHTRPRGEPRRETEWLALLSVYTHPATRPPTWNIVKFQRKDL